MKPNTRLARDPYVVVVILSRQEARTLHLISQGWTNEEIARELGTGVRSLKNMISRVFRKLGVRNRTEAARWAFINGIPVRVHPDKEEEKPRKTP